ncbi:MAG: hypothetical protein PW735_10945 [Acidobacteriaceae bacterium]|nr:hypothetical protein [Acidobacteriaceae bacterium]
MDSYSHGLLASMIMVFVFVFIGIFLIPKIFYLLTLQNALKKCAPQSRTMEPPLVWLFMIPVVDIVFHFFIVLALSKSLRNEFSRRGVPGVEAEPGQALGIAMAVSACCMVVPFLGTLACIAYFILWVLYWVKIASYSKMLDVPVEFVAYPQQ